MPSLGGTDSVAPGWLHSDQKVVMEVMEEGGGTGQSSVLLKLEVQTKLC